MKRGESPTGRADERVSPGVGRKSRALYGPLAARPPRNSPSVQRDRCGVEQRAGKQGRWSKERTRIISGSARVLGRMITWAERGSRLVNVMSRPGAPHEAVGPHKLHVAPETGAMAAISPSETRSEENMIPSGSWYYSLWLPLNESKDECRAGVIPDVCAERRHAREHPPPRPAPSVSGCSQPAGKRRGASPTTAVR